MNIQWYGHSCFRLAAQNRDSSIIIDPFDASIGWKLPRLQADIVAITTNREDHNFLEAVKKEGDKPFVIKSPGEYEVDGIFVVGFSIKQQNKLDPGKEEYITIYSIGIDDLYVCHLGDLNRPLTSDELDHLGRVDVLLIPVGGHEALNSKTSVEVISQIEPRVVIPMHYKLPGIKLDLEPVDAFAKEYGLKTTEVVDKLKLLKKDLPADETKIITLNPL